MASENCSAAREVSRSGRSIAEVNLIVARKLGVKEKRLIPHAKRVDKMAGIERGLSKAACSQAHCLVRRSFSEGGSTVGTNNAAQALLDPVRGCGSSGSSRR